MFLANREFTKLLCEIKGEKFNPVKFWVSETLWFLAILLIVIGAVIVFEK